MIKNLITVGLSIGIILGTAVFLFTRDTSLPYHLWVKCVKADTYKKNDYILLKYIFDDKYVKDKKLIKRITCVPGEHIKRVQNGIFCNGTWLGNVLGEDKEGQPLPKIELDKIIPDDYFFVQGTNPRSYDSRYFGLVPKAIFIRKVYPLSDILGLLGKALEDALEFE